MPYDSRWSVPIPNCSLPTFLLQSASHQEPPELANKKCYIDANDPDNQYFTRATYKLWAQRLALGITRLPNFKPGDRILLFSGTSLCFPVAFMGIIMAGGIFSAANPSFTARELAHQLSDSGASYLFVMEASLETAVEAATTVGLPLDRVRILDASAFFGGGDSKAGKNGIQSWGSIFASEEEGKNYQWAELKGIPSDHHQKIPTSLTTPRPQRSKRHPRSPKLLLRHHRRPKRRHDNPQKLRLQLPPTHAPLNPPTRPQTT